MTIDIALKKERRRRAMDQLIIPKGKDQWKINIEIVIGTGEEKILLLLLLLQGSEMV